MIDPASAGLGTTRIPQLRPAIDTIAPLNSTAGVYFRLTNEGLALYRNPSLLKAGVSIWRQEMLTPEARAAARKSKEVRADAHAIDLAPLIADLRASGKVGSTAIAAELVRLRIPTAYGQRSWGASQVVGVLKRLERLSQQEPT